MEFHSWVCFPVDGEPKKHTDVPFNTNSLCVIQGAANCVMAAPSHALHFTCRMRKLTGTLSKGMSNLKLQLMVLFYR